MNFIISASTDVGIVKSTNQDSLSVKVANTNQGKVAFAVLCDGMGGMVSPAFNFVTDCHDLAAAYHDVAHQRRTAIAAEYAYFYCFHGVLLFLWYLFMYVFGFAVVSDGDGKTRV